MGIPTFGRQSHKQDDDPQTEVLGTVSEPLIDPAPAAPSNSWSGPSGNIDLNEPPPPWELHGFSDAEFSDAHNYVKVPDNWELHWINPRLLESAGWRYWQPVMGSDPRVTLKVSQMEAPDGTIRRGGATGDILGWMYKSWADSRRAIHKKKTDEQTASSVRKQEQLKEEFDRGSYGRHVHLDSYTHPTHTIAEGKSLRD